MTITPVPKPKQKPSPALQAQPQFRDTRLRGGWLWAARLAAFIGILVNTIPVFVGFPAAFAQLQRLESINVFQGWTTGEVQSAITALGLSTNFVVFLILVADLIILLSYCGVGLLLFLRNSDRWFGLIVPYILFGLGVGTSILMAEAWSIGVTLFPSGMQFPLEVFGTMIWPAFFVSLFLFPDGRFAPKWSWILALGPPLVFLYVYIFFYTPDQEIPVLIIAVLLFFVFAGLSSQIYRYLRVSSSAQRQQTKWVLFGMFIFILAFFVRGLTFGTEPAQKLLSTLILSVGIPKLFVAVLPIALAISLTRYRLWDVDELINRALVYGLLTTFFAAVFATTSVLINQVTAGVLGEQSSTLAPVLSAVVVAAIFQPTRKRVEEWIDKRFYPHKKDLSVGLVEIEQGFWPFISLPRLLDSSLSHIAETLKCQPTAVYLKGPGGRLKPVRSLGVQIKTLHPFTVSKKQLAEFERKRVAAFEGSGSFSALVPLAIAGRSKGMLGTIAFGPRANGRGYSGEDLKSLVELGSRIALAIHAVELRSAQKAK